MSLGCGACRRTIYIGFGFMYRLVLDGDAFAYEDRKKDYVPPNGAVCMECYSTHVDSIDEAAALVYARHGGVVYAFQRADSLDGAGGAAQWSSACGSGAYQYYRATTIERWLPKLIEVIGWDAQNKKYGAVEDGDEPKIRLYGADPYFLAVRP